jgi:hypothetical protein
MFIERLKGMSQASGNEKVAIVTTAVVILALIVDMELSNVADILHKSVASGIGFIVFITISIIYLSGQHLLVRFAKAKTLEFRSRRKEMRSIDPVVFSIEAIIISVFVLVILEIQLEGYYGMVALPMTIIMSNGLTAWIMFNLSKRLYVYYKSHKDRTILSYLISGIVNAGAALVSICLMVPVVLSKDTIITATTPVIVHSFNPGSTFDNLSHAYYILTVFTFLSVWVSTVLLLSIYSKKLGKMKYWLVISLPLIFYLSQVLILALIIAFPPRDSYSITFIFYYRVIFTVSSTLGGILFAMPFILISRRISKSNRMHHQLIIFGLGMALFFVSGSATVIHAPFPPFGLATVALAGISSYLMFLGLYSSAISLSEDSTLRRQIRKSAEDSKFFLKLSDAEVEKRIIDQVEGVKLSMTADTGVAPSISIEEARDYLSEVLKEMKKEGGR